MTSIMVGMIDLTWCVNIADPNKYEILWRASKGLEDSVAIYWFIFLPIAEDKWCVLQ